MIATAQNLRSIQSFQTAKNTTAIAHANVALIKYWGKRNAKLMLPFNGSISVTLGNLTTTTTVSITSDLDTDLFVLNGETISQDTKEFQTYVGGFLGLIRKTFPFNERVKIVSENNFPTGAGLASSASGFAALAAAINEALELKLDKRELSVLARRGSGSATRSVFGGFVEWQRGVLDDGTDSHAVQLAPASYWPELRVLIGVTSTRGKKVKSRAGMADTVKNCPIYSSAWLGTVEDDLRTMRRAISEKNFRLLGETAERNCLKMHATMLTTRPPLIYWNGATLEVMNRVLALRSEGLESYFTIDAGPQVKVLCLEENVHVLAKELSSVAGVKRVIETNIGEGVQLSSAHLTKE